jgi:hypothetical protein
MIFSSQNEKVSKDGEFIKLFMDLYNNAKTADPYQNIGWKLVNDVIPDS